MNTRFAHIVFVTPLLMVAVIAYGNDYHDSENLAAASAGEVSLARDRIDREKERRPSRRILEELWEQAPPFWRDSALDAPEDLGRTGILAPDQSDLSVISKAYLQYDFTPKLLAKAFRQDFNMPYINRQDSRMIPNTHEAYVIRRQDDPVEFIGGHQDFRRRIYIQSIRYKVTVSDTANSIRR